MNVCNFEIYKSLCVLPFQLQQYGQPPPEILGDEVSATLLYI